MFQNSKENNYVIINSFQPLNKNSPSLGDCGTVGTSTRLADRIPAVAFVPAKTTNNKQDPHEFNLTTNASFPI